MDRETVRTHVPGQRQRRGELHQLGGLQGHGTDHDPRTGPVHLLAHEKHSDKDEDRNPVKGIGQHVPVFVVHQQNHHREHERDPDPDHLHAVALSEVENPRVRLVVNGGVDIEPAQENQHRIDEDRHPVHSAHQRAVTVTYHRPDSRFACFSRNRPGPAA